MDWIIIGGLLIIIVMQILLRPKQLNNNKEDLEKLLNEIQRSFDHIEKNFREDFRLNREESRLVAKDNREELAHSMNEFREAFERGIDSFNRLQKEKFAALDERQQRLVDNTEKRLEEIRVTVDEKLQKTLNDRIGQSFRLVTEQLESVQKGLGEMQTLAQDVGGLVMSRPGEISGRSNSVCYWSSYWHQSNTRRMYIPGKVRTLSLNSLSSSPDGMMPENSYTFP